MCTRQLLTHTRKHTTVPGSDLNRTATAWTMFYCAGKFSIRLSSEAGRDRPSTRGRQPSMPWTLLAPSTKKPQQHLWHRRHLRHRRHLHYSQLRLWLHHRRSGSASLCSAPTTRTPLHHSQLRLWLHRRSSGASLCSALTTRTPLSISLAQNYSCNISHISRISTIHQQHATCVSLRKIYILRDVEEIDWVDPDAMALLSHGPASACH